MKRKAKSTDDREKGSVMPQNLEKNDKLPKSNGLKVGHRVSMRTETGEDLYGAVAKKHSLEFVYVRWDHDERQKKKVRIDRLTKITVPVFPSSIWGLGFPLFPSLDKPAVTREKQDEDKDGEEEKEEQEQEKAGIEEDGPNICGNSVDSIMTGDMVMNRFEAIEPLGEGGTAVVWKGVDTETGKLVAIKRIVHKLSKMLYDRELDVLYNNASNPRVPNIIGEAKDDRVVVMEFVGQKTVKDYAMHRATKRLKILGLDSFSVAAGMIAALRPLHDRGWAHRDIKPANFVVPDCPGAHKAANLKIVDFGLSKSFVRERKGGRDKEAWPNMVLGACTDKDADKEWCIREETKRSGSFRGTAMYASRRAHDGMDVGRADDLIGVVYTFLDLVNGGLSWREFTRGSKKDRHKVRSLKDFSDPSNKWCPCEVLEGNERFKEKVRGLIDYLESVVWEEGPDYDRVVKDLKEAATFADSSRERGAVKIKWSEREMEDGGV